MADDGDIDFNQVVPQTGGTQQAAPQGAAATPGLTGDGDIDFDKIVPRQQQTPSQYQTEPPTSQAPQQPMHGMASNFAAGLGETLRSTSARSHSGALPLPENMQPHDVGKSPEQIEKEQAAAPAQTDWDEAARMLGRYSPEVAAGIGLPGAGGAKVVGHLLTNPATKGIAGAIFQGLGPALGIAGKLGARELIKNGVKQFAPSMTHGLIDKAVEAWDFSTILHATDPAAQAATKAAAQATKTGSSGFKMPPLSRAASPPPNTWKPPGGTFQELNPAPAPNHPGTPTMQARGGRAKKTLGHDAQKAKARALRVAVRAKKLKRA